jgi:hypothetical protein
MNTIVNPFEKVNLSEYKDALDLIQHLERFLLCSINLDVFKQINNTIEALRTQYINPLLSFTETKYLQEKQQL